MGRKRLASGAPLHESQEFHMGRIEAETYANACRRAGYSQADAEVYVLFHGLYPYWLVEKPLTSDAERAAHEAWLDGVHQYVALEYQKPALPDSAKTSILEVRHNPKAEARRVFVEAGQYPSAKARLAEIAKLNEAPSSPVEAERSGSQDALEKAFHEAMLMTYQRAGSEVGYWSHRFRQAVMRHGGLAWAHIELGKRRTGEVSDGFQKLLDAGRLDLSVEALALQSEFTILFSEAELAEARVRLASFPDYAIRRPVAPEDNFAETLSPEIPYTEGTTRKVVVSVFERNPKAREACLAKHGYNCAVCSTNFEKVYGLIGRDFIHVHHKKPLAAVREVYQLDPVKDLVPVCPNCHAMLHTRTPPLSTSELKAILEEQLD